MAKSPIWTVARHYSRKSRADEQAKRSTPGASSDVSIPQASERFERRVCVYCSGTTGLRVGNLIITGPVCFCSKHAKQYQDDKAWEEKYKRENGL